MHNIGIYIYFIACLSLVVSCKEPEKLDEQDISFKRFALSNVTWSEIYKIKAQELTVKLKFDENNQFIKSLLSKRGTKPPRIPIKYVGIIHFAFEKYLNRVLKLGILDPLKDNYSQDNIEKKYLKIDKCEDKVHYFLDLRKELEDSLLFNRVKKINFVRVFYHKDEDKYSYQFYGERGKINFLIFKLASGEEIKKDNVQDVNELFRFFDPFPIFIYYGKDDANVVLQMGEEETKILNPSDYADADLLAKIKKILQEKQEKKGISNLELLGLNDLPKIAITFKIQTGIEPIDDEDEKVLKRLDMSTNFRLESPLEKSSTTEKIKGKLGLG